MSYRIEIGPKANVATRGIGCRDWRKRRTQDPLAGTKRRQHRSPQAGNMPDSLSGLCKLRVGDYRILYWVYHGQKLLRLYRVQHRSEVYRDL